MPLILKGFCTGMARIEVAAVPFRDRRHRPLKFRARAAISSTAIVADSFPSATWASIFGSRARSEASV